MEPASRKSRDKKTWEAREFEIIKSARCREGSADPCRARERALEVIAAVIADHRCTGSGIEAHAALRIDVFDAGVPD